MIVSKVAEFWTSSPTINRLQIQPTFYGSQNIDSGWKKLQSGWNKLNVDGSAKRNLLAVGGVIRTDQGEWKIGFCKFTGVGF